MAGHAEAKAWLRGDAELLRKQGKLHGPAHGVPDRRPRSARGRPSSSSAGPAEIGVPFVELKNFRDKWVGATEGNLETIFTALHALGQVVVFVDEADQATGTPRRRRGDAGLSGRIYAMLAEEMSDTTQPGQDHLDLRHEPAGSPGGRPEAAGAPRRAHPALPAAEPGDRQALFAGMARKLKMP